LKISKRVKLAWVVGAILAAGGAAVWLVWFKDRPARHFAVVQADVLYRGGQPDEAGLKEIIEDCRVRTVVNLRGPQSQPWWQTERDTCRAFGVRMVDVEISTLETAAGGIREFLAIVSDPQSRPVYVHCEAGSKRTGFAVAAYRIALQGWSYDAAVDEAEDMRFNTEGTVLQEYDRLLHLLAGGADWRRLGLVGPATRRGATRPAGEP
jgi:protein tyrosine/serine phosphatase